MNIKMRRLPQIAACVLTLGMLCLSAMEARSQPARNSRQPLLLSAEQIVLEEQTAEPYSEQGFTFTPASAVRNWVKTRLVADGTPGIVRVILLDASLKRQELKTKGGLRGWFSDDQKYRYDGRIHLRIVHQPSSPQHGASQAEAQASAYFTMPEDATVNQLEEKAGEMVRGLMQRTELELENNMLRYMPGVVR